VTGVTWTCYSHPTRENRFPLPSRDARSDLKTDSWCRRGLCPVFGGLGGARGVCNCVSDSQNYLAECIIVYTDPCIMVYTCPIIVYRHVSTRRVTRIICAQRQSRSRTLKTTHIVANKAVCCYVTKVVCGYVSRMCLNNTQHSYSESYVSNQHTTLTYQQTNKHPRLT
jgi:hypothetical protein